MLTGDIDISDDGELRLYYKKTLDAQTIAVMIYLTVGQLGILKNWLSEIKEGEK